MLPASAGHRDNAHGDKPERVRFGHWQGGGCDRISLQRADGERVESATQVAWEETGVVVVHKARAVRVGLLIADVERVGFATAVETNLCEVEPGVQVVAGAEGGSVLRVVVGLKLAAVRSVGGGAPCAQFRSS